MAKVRRTKGTHKATPPQAPLGFVELFPRVADSLTHLVKVAEAEGDVELERAIDGVAGLCMGCWLELHRIGDALEALVASR